MHLAFVLNNAPAGLAAGAATIVENFSCQRDRKRARRERPVLLVPVTGETNTALHLTVFNRPSSHARIFWEDSALLCAAYDKLQRQQTDRESLKRAIIAAAAAILATAANAVTIMTRPVGN